MQTLAIGELVTAGVLSAICTYFTMRRRWRKQAEKVISRAEGK